MFIPFKVPTILHGHTLTFVFELCTVTSTLSSMFTKFIDIIEMAYNEDYKVCSLSICRRDVDISSMKLITWKTHVTKV